MSLARYIQGLVVGSAIYIAVLYVLTGGSVWSTKNLVGFVSWFVVMALLTSPLGRHRATPKAITIVGAFSFLFMGAAMLYLTFPFDTFDAVVPALVVMLFPTALIGVGVYQLRRQNSDRRSNP